MKKGGTEMSARHVKKPGVVGNTAKSKSFLKTVYEYAETVLFAMLLLVLLFTFVFRVASVVGDSMQPTLYTRERLLLTTHFYEPSHGDIVVIDRYTQDPLIKRVIGVAGDTIRIDGVNGVVYRNGEALIEGYVSGPTSPKEMSGEITVPEGYIFVLGDNRSVSKDSRSAEIGLVDTEDVVGKAILRIWPIKRFGGVE